MKDDRATRTSPINTWKPKKPYEFKVEQDGQLFVCNFDRIFQQEKLKKFNRFMIKKDRMKISYPLS